MTNSYRTEALRAARIAYSYWQREAASPSFGCFDRQYWGWKKKDFADATLQAGVTLCVRLAEETGQTASLPGLLDGFVGYLERIQHRDGSFDQVYPFERTPGVVHDLLTPLIWLWRSFHLNTETRIRLETVIHRGAAYTLKSDETHGEIANHFAGYAWELINYGHTFNDAAATRFGRSYLDRTLALFNEREGWFREYDGADAGYQTRLLSFLTRIAELTGDEELWGVCGKAACFVEAMMTPDNALHPMLGVRSTALVYPSAFERLAARQPEFTTLAERIHDGWLTGKTPRPSEIDFENGIRIAEDAFEAAAIREARRASQQAPAVALAADSSNFDFADAGLHRRVVTPADGRRQALTIASRLGGVVVLHRQATDLSWNLAFENSGYLLHFGDDTRWLVRRADAGRLIELAPDRLRLEATFEQALHEDLTPFKMIVLRILNLTVLRSQWIGDLFRKVVVRRLISGHRLLPLRLDRQVVIADGGVTIVDRLIAGPGLSARANGARLYRCRRTIANHMASSRYFQQQEIEGAQLWLEPVSLDVLDGRRIFTKIG
ncbi:hypothetical protein KMZ29_09550 [Bradyrhizobium sediminis]|uniref:Heparinase n=1 Tax=Bradyrhizobium sediminis TaxID=2840469 RepID=A0A975NGY1_9BRAD|nr:hypothetical protein [Bradyrhizobium sediminis]QWG14872.1 hypothetical protein KMZ29_09550 [Bradyrhizobium sediminis]